MSIFSSLRIGAGQVAGALILSSALLGACHQDDATPARATAPAPAPAAARAEGPAKVARAGGVQRYGAELSATPAVELDTVLGDPDKYKGPIKVKGQIAQVCTSKGCWMALKGTRADPTVRVRFKDYGFFVPKDTVAGVQATCEGELQVKTLDEAMARHYASETKGVSPEQVLAIKGPQRELSFIARGVELRSN